MVRQMTTAPANDPLATIHQFIDRMPSLSTTVTKVLEVCNRPNTSPADLNRVISLDPVLTAQVLKLINSAYYSLPNQITSLARAIIMLGINTVKNLALGAAIIGTIKKSSSSLPMDTFWTHCLCTGVTARILAAACGVATNLREEYFVAGLLHDIGKIPLYACLNQEYEQALALADLEEGPLLRAEEMVLSCNHAEAGRLIAEKWKFGPAITDCISCHHTLEEAPTETRDMVAMVALANIFANVYEYGSAGDHHPEPSAIDDLLTVTGFSWSDLQDMARQVETEIDKAKIFLKVGGG